MMPGQLCFGSGVSQLWLHLFYMRVEGFMSMFIQCDAFKLTICTFPLTLHVSVLVFSRAVSSQPVASWSYACYNKKLNMSYYTYTCMIKLVIIRV